jgi:predicted membrane protein
MEEYMDNKHSVKRLLIGIVILLFGALLLAKNLGLIDYQITRYIFNWRMILIVIGIINLSIHADKTPGVVLLFIGTALYLPEFFDFHFNFWQLFWPGLLILVGIMLILRKNVFGACEKRPDVDSADVVDEVNVFGGSEKFIQSDGFQGGRVTCIFGGSNLNLIRSKLAKGKQYIDMFAVFGGLKLIIPEDWKVKIQVVSVFGGFKDGRISNKMNIETESELIIKGFVLFGGGEIKSF